MFSTNDNLAATLEHSHESAPLSSLAWPSSPRTMHTGADIIVIGDAEQAEGVCSALRRISASVDHVATLDQALERGLGRAMAHVLVSPLPEAKLASAIVELRTCGPVFVVVPEDFSDTRARELYDVGTHAVVEWPTEALLLPRMVQARLQLAKWRRSPGRDGDDALSRSIRTRLELARSPIPDLEVEVDEGVVTLAGRVDSVWKKERVAAMVVHMPGVRAVHTDSVWVVPAKRPDALIEQDVRGVLEIVLGPDASTVSCSVRDAAVVLVGNVTHYEDIQRVVAFIGNIRGVKVIRNLITASPAASRRDRGLAERLRTSLASIFPDCELQIRCFGPVAVVRGTVPRLSLKREIEDILAHQDGIERVVDKLEVAESSASETAGS